MIDSKNTKWNFRIGIDGKLILTITKAGRKWRTRDATTEDLKLYWKLQNEQIDISVDTNFNIDKLLG